MKSRSTYLMIFTAVCISLVMLVYAHPSYAAQGADNDPDKVRRAIDKVSSDRRFIYPDERVEFDLNSEELLRKLAEWEKERMEKRMQEDRERDYDREWDERDFKDRERRLRERENEGGVAGGIGEGGNGGDGDGVSAGTELNLKVFTYILYGLAVCVLAFIIYRLVLAYYPRLRGGLQGDENSAAGAIYESLDPAEQLTLAEQLLRQGRWGEALTAMMMSLLLTLDSKRIIRYHRSRTNREYLWPLKKHPVLYAVTDEFVHNFENMKYGYRTPDEEGARYMFDLFRQAESAIPKPTQDESTTEG